MMVVAAFFGVAGGFFTYGLMHQPPTEEATTFALTIATYLGIAGAAFGAINHPRVARRDDDSADKVNEQAGRSLPK